MAQLINVDGSNDPSYRYKMPRLVSKVEGKGNGVKTVLVNCVDVAAALKRTPAQVTKFFGCELGAMTKYEDKIERALVNGAFENKMLQEALTGYIAKFVLCPSCGNPETEQELRGKKKQAIVLLKCKACGACDEADNTHKLITFIVKEHGGNEDKKKSKKKDKESKEKDSSSHNTPDESVSSGERTEKKKKKKKDKTEKGEKKAKKSKKERKEKEAEDLPEEKTQSGDEADEDFGFGSLTVHDVAALDSAVDRTATLFQSVDATFDKVKGVQVNCGLKATDLVPLIVFGLVQNTYTPNVPNALTSLVKYLPLLGQAKTAFPSAVAFEVETLVCIEEAVVRAETEQAKEKARKLVPVLLKSLYDEELLQESTILAWHKGQLDRQLYTHKRYVVDVKEMAQIKDQAKPVITWLQEADSESDTEEEDEE